MSFEILAAMEKRRNRLERIATEVAGLSKQIEVLAEEAEMLGKEIEYISVNGKVPELAAPKAVPTKDKK